MGNIKLEFPLDDMKSIIKNAIDNSNSNLEYFTAIINGVYRLGKEENEKAKTAKEKLERGDSMNDDLISRKAAIKAMEESEWGYLWECEQVINVVKTLPSAEPKRKWISVTEALPKDEEFVLLTIRRLDKKYNQNPFISVGYISWNQSAWWCAHDGDCDAHNVNVLAWMPLPEPYKEDEVIA